VSTPKWPLAHRGLQVLICWLALLGLWEAAYRIIGWHSWVFPAPSHVLDASTRTLFVHIEQGDFHP
jgi:ABC-type nitrate/sulfonate/bicarbonate transport system permease component